ncbi:hypothetical protein ACCO45_012109 [Purpureocillium lilacinum]|uniref:Uncharacterized protein n=1 Tax=Purpureocillium lilacinum TaxID=33203 RepID=A0ACC4DDM6_PURLI
MYAQSALALALLPELLAARYVRNARRGVDCTFATGANPGDTCDSFASNWGISVEQLKSLNPGVDCGKFDGTKEYCVLGDENNEEPTKASTSSKVVQTTSTKTTPPPTKTTAANGHEPTQPGLAENCDKFHKVVDGDSCDDIEAKAGISHAQFAKWNPYINGKCSNLWLDYYVCVHVPGATTTAPGPKPTDDGHSPTQPGIAKNCDKYHKIVSGDQCDAIESQNKITHEQFLKWNPAIDSNCSNLLIDFYVCVHVPGAPVTGGPQPQMPNLDPKCKKYHKVGDGEGCYEINKNAGITLDQFRKWNPTVDARCSNLWAGYYVCVGV